MKQNEREFREGVPNTGGLFISGLIILILGFFWSLLAVYFLPKAESAMVTGMSIGFGVGFTFCGTIFISFCWYVERKAVGDLVKSLDFVHTLFVRSQNSPDSV
jgi:hypothetical protein